MCNSGDGDCGNWRHGNSGQSGDGCGLESLLRNGLNPVHFHLGHSCWRSSAIPNPVLQQNTKHAH